MSQTPTEDPSGWITTPDDPVCSPIGAAQPSEALKIKPQGTQSSQREIRIKTGQMRWPCPPSLQRGEGARRADEGHN